MFVELRDLEANDPPEFDLCVIGAGPAGITLARQFQGTGISVGLLESGGLTIEAGIQKLSDGTTTGPQYPPLMAVRQRAFGGTTGHWGGQSCPLDKADFEPRPWVADSGWPIPYSELVKYLRRASDLCGVPYGGYRWGDVHDPQEELALPLDAARFTDTLFRYSTPPRRFGEYFRDEIGGSDDITCLLHTVVTQIESNEAGTHVTHLEVATPEGRRMKVRARRFVLACGGIENSRLLLVSNREKSVGLGNDHKLVGRYFMEHPNFDSGVIRFSDATKIRHLTSPNLRQGSQLFRLDFKLNEDEQRAQEILNHSAFLVSATTRRTHMSEEVGFMGKVWKKLERAYEKAFDAEDSPETEQEYKLRMRLEQAPIASSRVTLGGETDALGLPRAQLDIRFSDAEGRTVEAVQAALAKALGRSGLGRMQIDFDPADPSWADRCGWQIHHCGGTRMHTSPSHGVVDTNSKVFGVDNLYIAGSSVFPTSGHANPTLNLVALTLRLADHLQQPGRL
jgi:choline dehydrogenase-like flavoprotein